MKSDPDRAALWKQIFNERAPDIDFRAWPNVGDPRDITCLLTWDVPTNLRDEFPNIELVYAIGAGVDHIDLSTIPTDVDLVRMMEPGIQASMNEYVLMSVLCAHRNLVEYINQSRDSVWMEIPVIPAKVRRVGIMGAGMLGVGAMNALLPLGFQIRLWSRSRKAIVNAEVFAGADELPSFLSGCDILVCLLPLTPETRGTLNAALFASLPAGAVVINVSRGGNLNQDDLITALDSGHLRAAFLDVCEPEPLPPESALWRHPKIVLTPHIATKTQPQTAADTVIRNIARRRRGEPMDDLVDRQRGY